MKTFRKFVQFTLITIAFAISSTLASCSSDVDPEDYDAVEKEVSKKELLDEIFFGSGKKSQKDKALISAGLERAKRKKDYDLVKKYFNLFANYDEAGSDQKMVAIVLIDYFLGEHQSSYANDILSITTAHRESKYIWRELAEKESLKTKIEKEEGTYLISLKSEEGINRLISILERPTAKPKIGDECYKSCLTIESFACNNLVPPYHRSSLIFNSRLDEYLDIALSQNNDVAVQTILAQYVEIAKYKTYEKKGKTSNFHDGTYVKVIGFSDQPKKDAIKRYKEVKELWRSLEN